MEKILIDGGNRLNGEVSVSGMKNSILPIIFACLLVKGDCILYNVPRVSDVENSKNKRISDLKLDVIADLTRKGLRQRQIAERLGLTQQTVSNRISIIRTEFHYLLQDEELVLQENACKNTSNDLVQTCTNDAQFVQIGTNCETGKNCESDTKKGPKYTSAGRLAELGF